MMSVPVNSDFIIHAKELIVNTILKIKYFFQSTYFLLTDLSSSLPSLSKHMHHLLLTFILIAEVRIQQLNKKYKFQNLFPQHNEFMLSRTQTCRVERNHVESLTKHVESNAIMLSRSANMLSRSLIVFIPFLQMFLSKKFRFC